MLTTAKPIFSTLRAGLTAIALTVTLGACGTTNWGFPYRPDVQQGNWITSEQVAQLQQGMTREQVRFILGTPTLQDVFRSNRWDYPYYNKPGYGEEQQRKFTVWFDGDSLVRWEGDEQPDRQPFQKADTGMTGESGANAADEDAGDGIPADTAGADAAQTSPIPGVTPAQPTADGTAPDQQSEADAQAQTERRRAILNAPDTQRTPSGAPSAGRNTAEPLR